MSRPAIIAVCGKGGVGKTSVSAGLIKVLLESEPRSRLLAVDADPAIGLASALGIAVKRTVDDIRTELVADLKGGDRGRRRALLAEVDYELFEAVEERGRLAFLAIGRPERHGCYCSVNDLLRDVIASVASDFDVVVIDCEAGVEQVNRRVIERITHLLQVSDGSRRGLAVAKTIRDVAASALAFEKAALLLNRVRDEADAASVSVPAELNCRGWLPEDDAIRSADRTGTSQLDLPSSAFHRALSSALGGGWVLQ